MICMLHAARSIFLALLFASLVLPARGEDWPQWRGASRDGQWHETGLLEKFPSSELTPKWRAEIGSGYCGPTVAQGRVFVMDRVTAPVSAERVHCFDEHTGKKLWS